MKNVKLNAKRTKQIKGNLDNLKILLDNTQSILFPKESSNDLDSSNEIEQEEKKIKYYNFGENQYLIFIDMLKDMRATNLVEIGKKPMPSKRSKDCKTYLPTRFVLDSNILYNKRGKIIVKNILNKNEVLFNLNNLNGLLVSYCSHCKKTNRSLILLYQFLAVVIDENVLNTSRIFKNVKYLKYTPGEFRSEFRDYLRYLWCKIKNEAFVNDQQLYRVPYMLFYLIIIHLRRTHPDKNVDQNLINYYERKMGTSTDNILPFNLHLLNKPYNFDFDDTINEIMRISDFNVNDLNLEKHGIKRKHDVIDINDDDDDDEDEFIM